MLTLGGGLGTRDWGLMSRTPRSQTWNPTGHIRAELAVFVAKSRAHRGLFVGQYEEVSHEPSCSGVLQHVDVREQQRLAQDDGDYRYIHWISNVAIPSGDD